MYTQQRSGCCRFPNGHYPTTSTSRGDPFHPFVCHSHSKPHHQHDSRACVCACECRVGKKGSTNTTHRDTHLILMMKNHREEIYAAVVVGLWDGVHNGLCSGVHKMAEEKCKRFNCRRGVVTSVYLHITPFASHSYSTPLHTCPSCAALTPYIHYHHRHHQHNRHQHHRHYNGYITDLSHRIFPFNNI